MIGNLKTMALPDLLQWASVNRKTGILELERNGTFRRVALERGAIVACSTDDATLIGHYLLSGGRIRPEQLRAAKERRQASGRTLVDQLVADGVLSLAEIQQELGQKAEETVYSLFVWLDADFRFLDGAELDQSFVEYRITIDEILLNGLQRLDETKVIRRVFHSSGIVLTATGVDAPRQIANSGMARRILRSIDGKRDLTDILLQAQGSEFLVLKFLYHLNHKGVLRVHEVRPPRPGSATLLDDPAPEPSKAQAVPTSEPARPQAATPAPPVTEEVVQRLSMAARELEGIFGQPAPAAENDPPSRSADTAPAARQKLSLGFDLSLGKIPLLRDRAAAAQAKLPAEGRSLLSLIDGRIDVGTLLGLSSLGGEGVLRGLRQLADLDLVKFQDAPKIETMHVSEDGKRLVKGLKGLKGPRQ